MYIIFVIRKDDSEQDYFKWSIAYVPVISLLLSRLMDVTQKVA